MEVVLFEKLIFNPYFNYNLTGFTKLQLQKSNVRVNHFGFAEAATGGVP